MPNRSAAVRARAPSPRASRIAEPQFGDLVVRFKQCLPQDRFVCLRCLADELGVETKTLSEAVLLPFWIGYSFASTHCGQCGEEAYCALSTETETQ